MTARFPETPMATLDAAAATLAGRARAWVEVPLREKVGHLREVMSRFGEVSADLVRDALAAKGVDRSYAGEDWVSGPLSVLRTARFLAATLEGIDRTGRVPLPDGAIRERPDGQVAVDVMPGDGWDRIQYPRWRAEVRMEPAVGYAEARHHLGGIHTKPDTATAAVAVVLGAGNVASIGPLDLIHKLFVEGHVAILKFNPVNEYVGPHVEHAFTRLVDAGFVRFAYGGPSVGDHLVHHPSVDEVHLTGSEHTYNAIVFGPGAGGATRRARGEPLLRKRITAELGNVSPVIVVPGGWKERDVAYQAEHVVTQVVQNAGYNCNAAKVIVLPQRWPQRGAFLDAVEALLAARPERPSYYPGTEQRFARAAAGAASVRVFGTARPGVIPPAIIEDLDPREPSPAFTEEAFCQVVATTSLPGDDPAEYLDRAVAFCNERLRGSLNATLLIDTATGRSLGPALARAVSALRYGAVGVNLWAAAAFPLGVTPWGAFPGNPPSDIQSGSGFVHNARLVDRPEKTVMSAPFLQYPKPPWSVFHRHSAEALERAAAFEAGPGPIRLLRLLGSALRP
ncbi:MAG: aldehyde dehydrogenase family protein [Actinomycetota bacterium]